MVGWHHLLNGHVFEQAQGVGDQHRSQHATVCRTPGERCAQELRGDSETTGERAWGR